MSVLAEVNGPAQTYGDGRHNSAATADDGGNHAASSSSAGRSTRSGGILGSVSALTKDRSDIELTVIVLTIELPSVTIVVTRPAPAAPTAPLAVRAEVAGRAEEPEPEAALAAMKIS
jgi:hypothetical protein